jgi:hypothetical protein
VIGKENPRRVEAVVSRGGQCRRFAPAVSLISTSIGPAQHTPSGRRSLSRACRPFMGLTLKGRNGSRPCENSGTFSHGPISFAFSSPETVQRRRNYGNLGSARPIGKFAEFSHGLGRLDPFAVPPRDNCYLRKRDAPICPEST